VLSPVEAVSAGQFCAHLDTEEVAAWVQICFILALNVSETDGTVHQRLINQRGSQVLSRVQYSDHVAEEEAMKCSSMKMPSEGWRRLKFTQ
jgi:hypothetical protein